MDERVRSLNDKPVRPEADYVLYWMQMNRRVSQNHALAYAATLANELGKPLLVYESLDCSYPEANDRFHTFLLEGVPETRKRLEKLGAGYVFRLGKRPNSANDTFQSLACAAAAIVTDDYPSSLHAINSVAYPEDVPASFQAIESSCVIPLSRHEKREYAAYTIRPKIKKQLADYLHPVSLPKLRHPFKSDLAQQNTSFTPSQIPQLVAECEIDHAIPPSTTYHGGAHEAERLLRGFLERKFVRYARERNEPSAHATSDMSPYLHFGFISALEIALTVKKYAEEHQMIADEYLEELIVRRELAFNFAHFTTKADCLAALPDWARETLRKHAKDPRNPVYSMQELDEARTHDDLWNATQKELRLRGKIHGYYRMYWGKKVLEWSPTCQDALERLIHFHNRYALDGRDPNTYTNVLWLFGLHDRPWTERPIFGMVRFMSYDGMKRKTDIGSYIDEIASLERTRREPAVRATQTAR